MRWKQWGYHFLYGFKNGNILGLVYENRGI